MFIGQLFGLGFVIVLIWVFFGPIIVGLYGILPWLLLGALVVAILVAIDKPPKDPNERKK